MGGGRCKRFAAIIRNGRFDVFNVGDEDDDDMANTSAEAILSLLRG
jgi:peroxiredoxin